MKYLIIGLLFLLFASCREYTPKPVGYNRINLPAYKEQRHTFPQFSFAFPDYIRIDTLYSEVQNQYWFNIVYPQFNAVIHCTYLNISKEGFSKAVEDSYHLAYSHAIKADEITQELYTNDEADVSGIIYGIEGNVATPAQFFVTDSIKHFLRGSFYYSDKVNMDSVAPITASVKQDIQRMIETFSWEQ